MSRPAVNMIQRPRKITRNRASLACSECRAAKLKCDRGHPCESCRKRNTVDSCSYPAPNGKHETHSNGRAEARLEHLEQLVQELVQTQATPASFAIHTQDDPHRLPQDAQITHEGSTHFSAMLDDIEELRQFFDETSQSPRQLVDHPDNAITDQDILFGGAQSSSLEDILKHHMPSRKEVDRCLAAYFRAGTIAAPFLHPQKFQRQYEQFWADPGSMPAMWVSILFSICYLAHAIGSETDASHRQIDKSQDFQLIAARCLAAGKYTQPKAMAVEAMAVYIQASFSRSLDPAPHLGIVLSTMVQAAYTLGYHRDPDSSRGISVFEGEMRRRTWSLCVQLDHLVSFQLGLPNSIQPGTWNTRVPRNLQNSDLTEDMAVLPPTRNQSEFTPTAFYRAKYELMSVFGKIIRHTMLIDEMRCDDVLAALDLELRAKYESLPEALRFRSISQSFADSTYLIVARHCIDQMLAKCLCVLHRKQVASHHGDSVRTCFDAASSIVSSFLEMYPEFKPGGQFHSNRWLLGSITWTDFLLGVMTLCLIYSKHDQSTDSCLDYDAHQRLRRMLEGSLDICREQSTESKSAQRTTMVIEVVLGQRRGTSVRSSGLVTDNSASQRASTLQTPPMLQVPNGGLDLVPWMVGEGEVWNDNFDGLADTGAWNLWSQSANLDLCDLVGQQCDTDALAKVGTSGSSFAS